MLDAIKEQLALLQAGGWSIAAIVRETGLAERSLRRYLVADATHKPHSPSATLRLLAALPKSPPVKA